MSQGECTVTSGSLSPRQALQMACDGLRQLLCARSQKQEVASYLNSTCYYVGPLLGPPLGAPDGVLNASLGAASDLCNLQDPWGAGAVLTAMQARVLLLRTFPCTGAFLVITLAEGRAALAPLVGHAAVVLVMTIITAPIATLPQAIL